MKTYGDGFFEKIPVFPKFGKNGQNLSKNRPFSIFLKIGSQVSLDVLDIVRGYYWPHFAENRMFGKIPVPDLRARKDQKTGIFAGLYLRNEKSYRKSDLIFGILSLFSTKNIIGRFSVSLPLHPENRGRKSVPKKVPKPVFQFSRVVLVGFPSYCRVIQRTIRAYSSEIFMSIAFSVLDLRSFL